ncbi:MAG TPA: aminoglycoside adenylyltransferase family protein [Amaricoccus sp.]|nr:aminoglycoside adenylyltransferase family protein [Amaricoccus sp.]
METQIGGALAVARQHLSGLVAACLYGSATEGGLRRFSDVDLLFLVETRPDETARRALATDWLPLSGAPGSAVRPLEATVLARSDLRPWRYPPWRVLQFGEWLRADLVAGILEPPQADPDVPLLIVQARRSGRALFGPPPAEAFEPVPAADVRRAVADSLPYLLAGWEEDRRNALLALARMWLTAETGDLVAKDRAADWAIGRADREAAGWLARARDAYLGRSPDAMPDAMPEAMPEATPDAGGLRAVVERLARAVEAALGAEARPRPPA